MRSVHSHSSLSSFENCPKQYHYRYVLKIPSETESIEAYLGKRVHEVLERLYQVVQEGRVPSLDQVIRRFQRSWDERFDPQRVRIVREENEAAFYRTLGERCLTNYYRSQYPFDGDETLGLEEPVQFALDGPGSHRIRGIIDRLVRARDGALEIHDFKTGQRVPPQRALDKDRQLALYQIGIATRFADSAPVRLVWHYVLHGIVRSSTRTPEQLAALRRSTIDLIDRIHADEGFAPKPGPLCGWCEYRERCPASGAARLAPQETAGADAASTRIEGGPPAINTATAEYGAAAQPTRLAPPPSVPVAPVRGQLPLFEA